MLALLREEEGVAARLLDGLGIELRQARAAVERIVGRGTQPAIQPIGLSPLAKRVIELAVDEARRLNHTYIGTEHLLLGIVREGEGVAASVLQSLGSSTDLRTVRRQILDVLTQG